jgi:hypothetical protein
MSTSQESSGRPFLLDQNTLRNAGLHVLTPSQQSRAVIVYDLSDDISIKQLSEFFGYCGGVEKIILNKNQNEQLFAVVIFEDENAYSTAILLNKAILNDLPITVLSYSDFVRKSNGINKTTPITFSSQSSYLEYLQNKKSAYEKAISLISMGYVTSQQALSDLTKKVKELDDQTLAVRQQIAEKSQPIVSTTKSTLESTSQKIQPVLGAAKEKTAQITSPVLNITKEKAIGLKEKINSSQVWENETVKQGLAVTTAAKEGLVNVSQDAWNAIKSSWLSFKGDVQAENNALRARSGSSGSSDKTSLPQAEQPPAQQNDQRPMEVDDFFTMNNDPAPSANGPSVGSTSYTLGNEENEANSPQEN